MMSILNEMGLSWLVYDEMGKEMMEAERRAKMNTTPLKQEDLLDELYVEEYSAFSVFIGKYGRSYATKNEHYNRFDIF